MTGERAGGRARAGGVRKIEEIVQVDRDRRAAATLCVYVSITGSTHLRRVSICIRRGVTITAAVLQALCGERERERGERKTITSHYAADL